MIKKSIAIQVRKREAQNFSFFELPKSNLGNTVLLSNHFQWNRSLIT